MLGWGNWAFTTSLRLLTSSCFLEIRANSSQRLIRNKVLLRLHTLPISSSKDVHRVCHIRSNE